MNLSSSAPPPERILVTGATGALGPAVVRALLARGHPVRALVRSSTAALDPGVDLVTGDLTDAAVCARAVIGVAGVVHLAALLHVADPPRSLRPKYQAVNVDATIGLLDAARQAGVRRFVFASTTAVYGPTSDMATEATPPQPDSWYAESKLLAETAVSARHHAGQFDTTILRLSAVYGPRIKGNYQRLLHALAAGRFVPISAGHHRRSLIFEDDAAAAFAIAIGHPAAAGLFNVTDGSPHELRAIIAAMCSALGRRQPRLLVPALPVQLGAWGLAATCRFVGRRPPSVVASVAKYLEPSMVDGSRLARDLDFRPSVDLDTGWRRTVDALRHAGALPRPATT